MADRMNKQDFVKVALSRACGGVKIPIDLPLLKGDFQFPLLEKGRCEKIENWKIDYLKSLMIFFPKPRFPQFFHSFRGR
jgi:hypothetical protein